MKTVFYVLLFVTLLGVAWGVFQGVKGIGGAEVAAKMEAQKRLAVEAAAKRAATTQRELIERAEKAEAEVAVLENKLAGVRDAASKNDGDDFIVFGNPWADWLRGNRGAKPGN